MPWGRTEFVSSMTLTLSGLVPGIHAGPPPRPFPPRAATPQDVDARNKSGHDVVGKSRGGDGRRGRGPAVHGRFGLKIIE